MSQYRNRKDGQVISEADFRAEFPNVAFPQVLDLATLDAYNCDPILPAPPPIVTASQLAVRNGYVRDGKGNWVHAWRVEELPPEVVVKATADALVREREAAKAARADKVACIVVEVRGNIFNGDEMSQGRMSRTLLACEASGINAVAWVLADNTTAIIPLQDLRQALTLAVKEQAALWPI
jgi:hypothetical protein